MKKYNVTVNGTVYEVTVEEAGSAASVPAAPAAAPAPTAPAAPAAAPAPAPKAAPAAAPAGSVEVKAPMPGTILKVNVSVGGAVKKGDILCILEAMKMENEILAPQDGTVAAVSVANGATVSTGDLLIALS